VLSRVQVAYRRQPCCGTARHAAAWYLPQNPAPIIPTRTGPIPGPPPTWNRSSSSLNR
jgi:hypothetical protein